MPRTRLDDDVTLFVTTEAYMNFRQHGGKELVAVIAQNPFMFDRTQRDYLDNIKRDKFWMFVAQKFGFKSSTIAREKWNNIRSSYKNYLRTYDRKMLTATPMEIAAEIYKPKWILWDCVHALLGSQNQNDFSQMSQGMVMDDDIELIGGPNDPPNYDDYVQQFSNETDLTNNQSRDTSQPGDDSDDDDSPVQIADKSVSPPRQTIIFRLDEPPNFQCANFTFKYMYQRTSLFCEHDQKVLCESVMDFFRQQVMRLENDKCKACK